MDFRWNVTERLVLSLETLGLKWKMVPHDDPCWTCNETGHCPGYPNHRDPRGRVAGKCFVCGGTGRQRYETEERVSLPKQYLSFDFKYRDGGGVIHRVNRKGKKYRNATCGIRKQIPIAELTVIGSVDCLACLARLQ